LPTWVVRLSLQGLAADTLGRRASYLLSVAIILLSTLLYVWFGSIGAGPVPFALASVILGVGFTFYTGAVDAWMVDALGAVGYEGKLDPIFARYGMTFGVFYRRPIAGPGRSAVWCPRRVLVPAFLLGLCQPTWASAGDLCASPPSAARRDASPAPASRSGCATGSCASSCSPASCRGSS
jgi:MFS family permease